jgi:hypothetical protein
VFAASTGCFAAPFCATISSYRMSVKAGFGFKLTSWMQA